MQKPIDKTADVNTGATAQSFRSDALRAAADAPRLPETGFLRQWQVLAFVPISKSTLWRRVHVGTFPGPVKLSARVTVWRAEDLRQWINSAASASSALPAASFARHGPPPRPRDGGGPPPKGARPGGIGGPGADL